MRVLLLPLDGMLVHRKVTPPPPSIMLLVPIYTPGWRETTLTWSKVTCLRKQHDDGDQAQTTNLQPSVQMIRTLLMTMGWEINIAVKAKKYW